MVISPRLKRSCRTIFRASVMSKLRPTTISRRYIHATMPIGALLLYLRRHAPVPFPRVRPSLPSHRTVAAKESLGGSSRYVRGPSPRKIQIDLPANRLEVMMTTMTMRIKTTTKTKTIVAICRIQVPILPLASRFKILFLFVLLLLDT